MADPLGGGWKRCSASTCRQCANGCQWQLGFHKWLQSWVHVAIQFHKSPNQSNFPRNSISYIYIDDKIHFIFMLDLADLAETKSLLVSRLVLVMVKSVKSPSVSFDQVTRDRNHGCWDTLAAPGADHGCVKRLLEDPWNVLRWRMLSAHVCRVYYYCIHDFVCRLFQQRITS